MTDKDKTKADLVEENDALRQDIVNISAERSELMDALRSLSDRIDSMEQARAAREADGETYDPAPDLAYDPFDEQNPHVIRNHPEGFVLSWKNPNLRAHKGWRGWVPITYDDEIGKNLDQYLLDPPPRMEGMAQIDNYIRRGSDSILCKLPKDLWDARQARRETRSKGMVRASAAKANVSGDGFVTYGEGAQQRKSADNTPLPPEGGPNAVRRRSKVPVAGD
jgi:hypothetical protein